MTKNYFSRGMSESAYRHLFVYKNALFVGLYMHVCTYYRPVCICMYERMYIQIIMPICMYKCMHAYMYVCVYIFMYALRAYVCMHVYRYVCIYRGGFCPS